MTRALFRVALPDGSVRLASGSPDTGPRQLLPAGSSFDDLLSGRDGGIWEVVAATATDGPVPDGARPLAPIGSQPVWAAGVTYLRSREGREAESVAASDVYTLVYDAERPELFFKGDGASAIGPEDAIGVRRDSTWDAPEPELVLVLDADLRLVGLTIGDDVSSRSIEGANPLYLPQAKVYERSCALGPAVVAFDGAILPAAVGLSIARDGSVVFRGETSTSTMRRSLDDLIDWLGRANRFPRGCYLMTGTGIVPGADVTLRAGDMVEISIEGLGVLRNPVVEVGRG